MLSMAVRMRLAVRRAGIGALLAVALAALGHASIARADGDPASDYLLANQVFVTTPSGSLSPAQRELVKTVAAANRQGYAIRVAVIANTLDLGAVTQLWRQPRTYARFLGEELSLAYKQRLLVVMPNGFGINWPGHSSAPEYRLLAKVPIKPGSKGLSLSTATAVHRLSGAHIPAAGTAASAPSSGPSAVLILLIVIVLVAVLAAIIAVRMRGQRRRPAAADRGRRPISIPRPLPLGVHVAIALAMVLGAGGTAAAIVVTHGNSAKRDAALFGSGRPPTPDQQNAVVTPPPYSWPASRRPAPGFRLRDQAGGPVSLASYRGRPVIVTFIDPVCRNVCPLEAKVLDQADQQIPLKQRPEILAVSVDRYADSRADLLKDARKWNLVPQWRWAVGSPARLAAVWKDYKVSVSAKRVNVRGRTITSITHTAAAYIIDKTGHERALFLWPFFPQDVEHELRKLT